MKRKRTLYFEPRKKAKRYHWLAAVINDNDYHIGAEVGAATGNTTQYLMDNCIGLDKLIVVDIWERIPSSKQWNRDDMKDIFLSKFAAETRIQILEGKSWEMAQCVPDRSLDFAFIDASHELEDVKRDIDAWKVKIKPSGILCGHDLHFPGVQQALAEATFPFEIAGVDNCWYVKGDWL